jgi:hypothetical protein
MKGRLGKLFNDAVSVSDDDSMTVMDRTGGNIVVAYLNMLYQHSPGKSGKISVKIIYSSD